MHSVILIVGDDIENILEQYDENLEVEPYEDVEFDIDEMIKHYLNEFEEFGQELKDDIKFLEYLKDKMDEWNGCLGAIEDGILKAYTTYNPDGRWDWYEVGGRWAGFFKIKKEISDVHELGTSGVFNNSPKFDADIAYKKDIDFIGMKKELIKNAEMEWDAGPTSIVETKEEYVARRSNMYTTAIIKDGDWIEIHNNEHYNEILDTINDDELLTIVDIHY